MHLARGLTTTGRKRGKQKFRNAEEAARARELDRNWGRLPTSRFRYNSCNRTFPKCKYRLS
jgi:hypothetical protein